jgi:hypothetical protein
MNRHLYRISLSLAVLLLLGTTVANAQSGYRLVADIPFDFHVGTATLPSGTYWVKHPEPGFNGIVVIQTKDGSKRLMIPTVPGKENKEYVVGKLVFNRYGQNYFLSEVQNPFDYATRCLHKSKLEKEIARNGNGGVQPVAVAMEKR